MPGTLSITGLVVCIVHFKYLYALRLILRYCTVYVYDIIVCALNITKDCGADQLDHEEDPVVGAVVLNQHQQYIDIEY